MATKGSGLKSTSINGVKLYMVSSQKRNPASWSGSKNQRPSRKDKRIYPPQIEVYELREFALKFERHLDSEIIDFQILDDDCSKLAFLCADHSVCLHAKYGKHYT